MRKQHLDFYRYLALIQLRKYIFMPTQENFIDDNLCIKLIEVIIYIHNVIGHVKLGLDFKQKMYSRKPGSDLMLTSRAFNVFFHVTEKQVR